MLVESCLLRDGPKSMPAWDFLLLPPLPRGALVFTLFNGLWGVRVTGLFVVGRGGFVVIAFRVPFTLVGLIGGGVGANVVSFSVFLLFNCVIYLLIIIY